MKNPAMSDSPHRTDVPFPWLQQPLVELLQSQHGHATLLHGAPGSGQFELALATAAGWLCEARTQADHVACGRCVSCRLIQAGTHPDLLVVLPEALQAALGWQAGEEGEGGDEDKGKSKKLSQEIKVDAIRRVVLFAQQTASRNQGKVVVIHPAEQLNQVAANTLLKTLEEPPGHLRFLLCTADIDGLLPTVRSRCQARRVPMPAAEVALSWLQAQGVPAEPAQVLLRASGGQPLTALAHHQAGLDARHWAALPKDMAGGKSASVQGWPLPLLVDALQKLCLDLACVKAGGAPRFYPVESLPVAPGLDRLSAWFKDLLRARRQAEHPWNQTLKVESLVLQARQVLKQGR
ncbi:MAG: polymerase subunit delta [Pseudomonadota bacterium]|jgi:DNA polymerase-3 subunit delta'